MTMSRGTRFAKLSLMAVLVSGLVSLFACGCGAAGGARSVGSSSSSAAITQPSHAVTTITTSVIPRGQRLRGDGDADNPGDIDGNGDVDTTDTDSDYPTSASYKFPDADDKATFAYGHRASHTDAQAIESTVKRYYAAAGADDGGAACLLLRSSFARSVPEAYGQNGGLPYLRGAKSCAALATKLFWHFHQELAEPITLVDVRVSGDEAQVVLSSRKMPASHMFLALQGRSWKIQELLGQPLP